ncbi:hypothetical protein [Helicobacter turcicus]|uniref:XRE family transcriptional regulator n=1 Tax=Helicobacter turcicus TaxID=2867412 RepID=A0ABS7JKK5_9HELI|nr:hypothetical protein [Helicobacter turcicus]MBX7489910.1 hypothetical protein [Helicobacter turcicus]MBX7544770.1 hypothetical protein [Helicobacter turcicus]
MSYEDLTKHLKNLGLSKEEFAQIVGMSYHSVTNWKAKEIPKWVDSWINLYYTAQKYDKIVELVQKELQNPHISKV